MFRPDQPIDSVKDDLLSRSSFAASLADAILAYTKKNSIVTALYGEWGSGKSSVINMALEHLAHASKQLPKEQKPIVIRFNPWNYSDQNQLLTQFFRELSVALKRKDYGADATKAGEQLEVYAEFFKPLALIPDPTGLATLFSIAGYQVVKEVGHAATKWGELKSKNLSEIRKRLDGLLENQQRKILIVIDDIDRLSSAETRQIFQLVKMLGDFPNTVYLLAFDRGVVIKALQKVQEGLGEEYLEKIVQIPFELPVISKQEVEGLLLSQLDELIVDIPEDKWDKTYWGNIYHSGLRHFFGNIRDVTRFTNSLRFAFSMVKDEVNPIDFLAITALQVFDAAVYAGIRDNKDVFSGIFEGGYRGRDAVIAQARKRCDEILQRTVTIDQEQLKDLLRRIFPKIESIYSNTGYGYDWLESWRRTARVCSPDVFDTFFRLSIPKGELLQKEIETILGMAGDPNAFSESLLTLKKDGRLVRFLERMEDYTREVIPEANIQPIVTVLMDIGDHFPEGQQGMLGTDTPMRLLRIMYQLTQRLQDQQKRFEIFRTAITEAKESLYTIVHEVGVQGQHHGKWTSKEEKPEPEEKRPVSSEQLTVLEGLACEKIRLWASDGRLKDHSKLISILYSWKRWCDDGEKAVSEYVNNIVKTETGLIGLIHAFVGKSYSHGMSDYVTRVNWRISLKSVADFVSVDELTPRVRAILDSNEFQNLSADNQRALQTFIDTVDGKVKEW
jgi:predicted KAP-like P-loop ATPase